VLVTAKEGLDKFIQAKNKELEDEVTYLIEFTNGEIIHHTINEDLKKLSQPNNKFPLPNTSEYNDLLSKMREAKRRYSNALSYQMKVDEVNMKEDIFKGDCYHHDSKIKISRRAYDQALDSLETAHSYWRKGNQEVGEEARSIVVKQAVSDGEKLLDNSQTALQNKNVDDSKSLCDDARESFLWGGKEDEESGVSAQLHEIFVFEVSSSAENKILVSNGELKKSNYDTAISILNEALGSFREVELTKHVRHVEFLIECVEVLNYYDICCFLRFLISFLVCFFQ